jgi:hypothetical protein
LKVRLTELEKGLPKENAAPFSIITRVMLNGAA